MIDLPREDSAISLMDIYLETDFKVTHRIDAHAQFADGDRTKLVFLGPIASFNKNRLTNPS